ncbi:MAG: DUF4255 domain-containing protein [Candidatus Methanoperedens sp.]|nr:DUF4255 domain-containing protein [Candidatus Methanoperedens sp.]CAG0963872.1 hypothetical protein METP1_00864 [Methanosarcinales archaeon]
MSDTAIADVGIALINLLRANKGDIGIDDSTIMLISPGEIEANDNVRISLFLYQVREYVHMRNQETQQIDSKHFKNPPLPLELYYMLTAYPAAGDANRNERTKDEHHILGKAMQILYDNTILNISGKKPRITLNTMSLDDMTKIWTTFQGRSYRPSACYLVTPVMIESENAEEVTRVISKKTEQDEIIPKREE